MFSKTFSRSYPPTAPKSGGKDVSKFLPGKRVEHKKFGIGTIIAVKNNGGNPIADIAFKGFGVKSFSIALAPMEVID